MPLSKDLQLGLLFGSLLVLTGKVMTEFKKSKECLQSKVITPPICHVAKGFFRVLIQST